MFENKEVQALLIARRPENVAQACYLVDYGNGGVGTCTPVFWERERAIGMYYPIHAVVWADGTIDITHRPLVQYVKTGKAQYVRTKELV